MFILGINGWHMRSHDPSACIVKNGKILAMAEEERFIRQKHAFEKIPINAINFCLNEAGITSNDIGIVAFGWDYRQKYILRKIKWRYNEEKLLDIIFPSKIFKYKNRPKLVIVPHHLAHAASVFWTSGFKKSTILVIDGQGEDSSTSIWYGDNKKIKLLKSFSIQDSLGYFYESINKYIGFHYLDGGKTMGLAPHGKPIFHFKNIKLTKNGYHINLPSSLKYDSHHLDEQEALVTLWHRVIRKYIKKPNLIVNRRNGLYSRTKDKLVIPIEYKHLSASAQLTLEKIIEHLANISINLTKCRNLCLSGGVALNCSANGKLLYNKKVNNLYIFPPANDAGVSAGAAFYTSVLFDKNAQFSRLRNSYLGPSYTNPEIKRILDKGKLRYKSYSDIWRKTALLLSKGKIIGWFQGKMEVGPRALGNRSILADPRDKKMWRKVNIIKGRELWRPLAPTILDKYRDEYFENAKYSPFMLKTFKVKKDKRKLIPAVVHVDGSTRSQTLSKKDNKIFWYMIKEFHKITGIPVVLNTSFNGPGEPIVCTPEDAIRTFYNINLDYLVINNFLLSK